MCWAHNRRSANLEVSEVAHLVLERVFAQPVQLCIATGAKAVSDITGDGTYQGEHRAGSNLTRTSVQQKKPRPASVSGMNPPVRAKESEVSANQQGDRNAEQVPWLEPVPYTSVSAITT